MPSNTAKEARKQMKLERAKHREQENSRRSLNPFQPKNEIQQDYYETIFEHDLVFGLGPAGTGKTFVAVRAALDLLVSNKINKIFITRPIVEADDEEIGILPGGIDEKLHPYFYPIQDAVGQLHNKPELIRDKIEIAPLAFMRGRTFWNCAVILDEAQNTTPNQMKMFLTRLGEGCRAIVNGDLTQRDKKGKSGLEEAVYRLEDLPQVDVVEFGQEDVVRSSLVKRILNVWPD